MKNAKTGGRKKSLRLRFGTDFSSVAQHLKDLVRKEDGKLLLPLTFDRFKEQVRLEYNREPFCLSIDDLENQGIVLTNTEDTEINACFLRDINLMLARSYKNIILF